MNVSSEKGIIAGILQPRARDKEEPTRERCGKKSETRSYKIVCREAEEQTSGREKETPSRRGSDLLQVDVDFRRVVSALRNPTPRKHSVAGSSRNLAV